MAHTKSREMRNKGKGWEKMVLHGDMPGGATGPVQACSEGSTVRRKKAMTATMAAKCSTGLESAFVSAATENMTNFWQEKKKQRRSANNNASSLHAITGRDAK